MEKVSAVILAAGKSKRIKSGKSKLLLSVLGVPVIDYILKTILSLDVSEIYLVLGHLRKEIEESAGVSGLKNRITVIEQKEQLGTGHAVKCTVPFLNDEGKTLIVSADVPLIRAETLINLINSVRSSDLLGLLAFEPEEPHGYGRVIRGSEGIRVVEEKDATPEEKLVCQANAGVYCVRNSFLKKVISKLGNKNSQGEYYLTDIVKFASEEKKNAVKVVLLETGSREVLGMNDRKDLFRISSERKRAINEKWMEEGVTLHDPVGTIIEEGVKLASDVEIYPGCVFRGKTVIESGVTIFSGAHITDSKVEEGVTIKPYCVIEASVVKKGATIGPFAHIRPGSEIGENARVGNFVELKKTKIGENSKASHLTYLGDAEIGKNVNIGCGTITCNYDGLKKHRTIIEDEVFIGSDTQLIAPVRVGKGAYTASGSTITEDVPPGALAIARSKQTNKPGYAEKLKSRKD